MEGEHPTGSSEQKCNLAALNHLPKAHQQQLFKLSLKLNGMEKILKLRESLNYNCQINLSEVIALLSQIDWRNLVEDSRKGIPASRELKV